MNEKNWKELSIFAKTSVSYELCFRERSEGNAIGNTLDITDWTIYFMVKEKLEDVDTSAKINKKITIHTDPTLGKTLIELTPTDTNLTQGSYYYEISYKDNETTPNEKVVIMGRFKVEESVIDSRI